MLPPSSEFSGESRQNGAFCTTHWSAVLCARDQNSPGADKALASLCEAYWYPLYVYVRRRGYGPIEAEDLTQAFFARVIQGNYLADITPGLGRFRSFLLTSFKHFLANEWDRAHTQKRGGDKTIFSLDDEEAESRYQFELVDDATPELIFEKRWALVLLERVLMRLRQEFVTSEKSELFDQLKTFLTTDQPESSYAEIAARTGGKEGTIKVAVHRLRRRYGELLRAEIAETVSNPNEVEDEVRHLITVLGR